MMKIKSNFKDICNENICLGDFVTFKKDDVEMDGYIDYFELTDEFLIISKHEDNFKAYLLEDYVESCKIIERKYNL